MVVGVNEVLTELHRMIESCGGDGRSYRSLITRYIKELEDKVKHSYEGEKREHGGY